jgi:sugar lactone lactonase YvrE
MPPGAVRRVFFATGFKQPESVLYDAEQDVYFVSNIVGGSAAKDGRAYISRLRPDGVIDSLRWISGGRNEVTLNAPKGMAITGDTLWVTDIDVVRGFDRRTGAPVATVDLAPHGAVFLNDLVAAPNGAIYATDTQIKPDERGNVSHPDTDRLFRIGPDRVPTIALSTDRLMRPNGIALDRRLERFIIASYGGDTIFAWKPGSGSLIPLASGPGQFDGIEMIADGRVFVTSQATGSVWELRESGLVEVITNLPSAADLGYDVRRNRFMIPLLGQNSVMIYEVP